MLWTMLTAWAQAVHAVSLARIVNQLKHESLKSLPHRQQTLFRDAGMEADTDDPGTQLQLPIQKAGQEARCKEYADAATSAVRTSMVHLG